MSLPVPSRGDEDRTLKVLSLNVWGLAFISKDRPPRIKAIAEYLATTHYDVVCLQEIWIYKDFEIVREEVLQNLPFSRFFHTGALGSGLAIFTRYPLISAMALPYSLSGTPQKFVDGDFFVNKAAANVVILHPLLGEVEIWNTHMHAAGEAPPDTRQAHRIAQSWQLANQVRSGAAKGRYVLVMGDFNSQPFSVPIAIMRSHGELSDSFVDAHPYANTSSGRPVSPENGVTLHGMTCDSPLNTYSHGKPIPAEITSKGGKRLDYIFYRQPEVARRRPLIWGYRDEGGDGNIGAGAGAGIRDGVDGALEQGKPLPHSLQRAPVLRCAKSEVVLTGRVPGKSFSYSDHFGLSSTFVVDSPASSRSGAGTSGNPTESEPSRHSTESSADKNSFTPLVPLMSEPEAINPTTTTFALPELPRSPPTSPRASSSLPHAPKSSILRTALATLRDYTAISRRNRLLHLRLSAAAVVILLGLTIGSAWQPKSYIQPIFTLLAAVLGGAGATFFYLGFLWGKWEEGLLTEVREEMELELRVVEVEERATRSA